MTHITNICYVNDDCYFFMFQWIPMAVLYGVFLFMGISSLKGIQVCLKDFIDFGFINYSMKICN